MKRPSRLAATIVAALLVLSGCAPRVASVPERFAAAFSARGALWVRGGQAFVARAPQFRPEALPTPAPVADVAWHDLDAWAALPGVGWVQRLTGAGGVVRAGVAVKLSATRIYREDGSALSYDGAPAGGLLGAPDAVETGGDGNDYALQGGRLYRVTPVRALVSAQPGGPFLAPTPQGVVASPVPVAVTADFTYRLTGSALERVDAAGSVRGSVPHGPGLVGVAGEFIVTVSREGAVRVFRYDLTEVKP